MNTTIATHAARDLPQSEAPMLASGAAAYTRVEVHWDLTPALLDLWGLLEVESPATIYQTRAWLVPWIETLGREAGVKPFFVAAFDGADTPIAFLCLGLRRYGPLGIAGFLGGKDSNLNLPLLRRGHSLTPQLWRRLLRETAKAMGPDRPAAFLLLNQARVWAGTRNSLAELDAQPSPSAAYGTKLADDAETLFAATLSKATRKKLRKKESALAEIGPLHYATPATDEAAHSVLDAFFSQKIQRLAAKRVTSHLGRPAMRAFLERVSAHGPYGRGMELHALYAGEEIVAIYGGASHQGAWSGMLNSFDAREAIARCSPGDLLLKALMTKQCRAGLTYFDLGIGEARYKSTFCGEIIPLADSLVATGTIGHLIVPVIALALRMKGAIKRNRLLFTWLQRARATVAGLSSRP